MLLTLSEPELDWFTPWEKRVTTFFGISELLVEAGNFRDAQPTNFGGFFQAGTRSRERIHDLVRVLLDELFVTKALSMQVAQQAIEQGDVAAGLEGKVLIGNVAGGRAARVDNDHTQARTRFFRINKSLINDGVAPGEVGAGYHHQIGLFNIFIATGHHIGTKCAFVPGDRRRHAQTRIGINVGRAQIALREFVGDVVILGQHLSGDI